MRLKEYLKLSEGRVRPEVLMILDRVIANEKITDGTDIAVLGQICQAIASGNANRLTSFEQNPPTAEVVDYLKGLSGKKLVKLATQCKELMSCLDPMPCCDGGAIEWIKDVCKAQE